MKSIIFFAVIIAICVFEAESRSDDDDDNMQVKEQL